MRNKKATTQASDLEYPRLRMVHPLQQPAAGTLPPHSLILNPWGYNALPIHLRLEEGCTLRFVVRKVTPAAGETEVKLSQVGGRLLGRTWYNTIYGGTPNRL